MHSPTTPFPTRLAVSDDVAKVLEDIDEASFVAFKDAISFAEEVLPDFLTHLHEAEAILILHADIGLIICFDKKRERYFVAAILFGNGDSPDPGESTLMGRRAAPSLVETVLSASGIETRVLSIKALAGRKPVRAAGAEPDVFTPELSNALGKAFRRLVDSRDFSGRSLSLRPLDLGGQSAMKRKLLGNWALRPIDRTPAGFGKPSNRPSSHDSACAGDEPAGTSDPSLSGC